MLTRLPTSRRLSSSTNSNAPPAKELVDELNAKAAASDELANRLKAESLDARRGRPGVRARRQVLRLLLRGRGETCECPDGDVVWGPRYHASDPDRQNNFADVIATQNFIVKPGKSDYECTNEHFGADPEPGESKACFCAPKGLNYNVKASIDGAQPTPAPAAVSEQPAPPGARGCRGTRD